MRNLLGTLISSIIVTTTTTTTTTAAAAPAISGVSGNVSNAATVVVRGTGFLTKSPAKPLAFSDFEDSLDPVLAYSQRTTWDYDGSHDASGFGATAVDAAPGGTRSARWDMSRDTGGGHDHYPAFGYNSGRASKFYIFAKRKYAYSRSHPENMKIYRFTDIGGWPGPNIFTAAGSICLTFVEYANESDDWHDCALKNQWVTEEMLFEESSLDTSNGYYLLSNNGVQVNGRTAWITRTSSKPNSYNHFLLQNDISNESAWPGGRHFIYYDDVYMDNTWARVMIGDASTLAASRVREIQLPAAWTTNEITVAIRQGAIAQLTSAYMYVVNEDGEVNAAGYSLAGSTGGPTPPAAPINLIVR